MLPSGRQEHYLWETWMDTPHTPRDGFPVEIQMLWIACLGVFRPVMQAVDPGLEGRMQEAEIAAWQALQRFNVRGIPADGLDGTLEVRDLITPNPYFCFGIGLDLGPEVERTMREVGRRQLAGQQGILTLAPQDWERVFPPEFLSDRRHVRGKRMRSIGKFNYHRGVEWNWLSQFFVQGELKYGEPDVAYRKYLRGQVDAALDRGGIGGIGEIFDLAGTRGPDFQAWSMSGFLESLHAFAGVRIDVPQQRIVIEPQIPGAWPRLAVRKWYGGVPFDLRYTRDDRTQSLSVEFPWGEAPSCDLEIRLLVPAHRAAGFVDVRLDGEPQSPVWQLEPLPGTEQSRLVLRVPACASVEVTLGLKRSTQRMLASA
jgi:glycogen debranching enzyme